MAITTRCSFCAQKLATTDEYAGLSGHCPKCGAVVPFPHEPDLHSAPVHDPLTLALLIGAIGALLLLVVGLFLPWQGAAGVQRGDGRLLLCLALLLLGLLIATLQTGFLLPVVGLIAGGFATFCFFFLMPHLSRSAQLGLYLCLLASVYGSGSGLALAVRHPLPPVWAPDLSPLLRQNVFTIVAHAGGVLLALLTWVLRWVTG